MKKILHLRPNRFVRFMVKASFQALMLVGALLLFYGAAIAPVSLLWKLAAIPFAGYVALMTFAVTVAPWRKKKLRKK